MKQQKKLSKESYKGTRDFYPEDMAVRKYIFNTMRKAVEKFGYVEYDASMVEETDLYRAKSGEEIVNEQTYSFKDRGGRDVTIRPEMTPTVARMIAKKRKELSFPLRWYSIPNLFRYERPQKGRLREHWQLNVDMFGVDSIAADVEMIAVPYAIMNEFGAQNDQFVIKVNDRRITNFFLSEYLGMNETEAHSLSKLIDKKEKMPEGEFFLSAQEVLGEQTEKFVAFLNIKDITALPEEFSGYETVKSLAEIIDSLADRGITNVVYDPSIMRGFDYYTGVVFEVFDTSSENNRSMFGGGRYDDLVGIFDVEKVSAIGFGAGDVIILDFLKTHNLIPGKILSVVDLCLCVFEKKYERVAQELADHLRKEGLNVSVDISERKIASQIKTADKQDVKYIICIGEDEVQTGKYKLKDMDSREEKEVAKEEIVRNMEVNNEQTRKL